MRLIPFVPARFPCFVLYETSRCGCAPPPLPALYLQCFNECCPPHHIFSIAMNMGSRQDQINRNSTDIHLGRWIVLSRMNYLYLFNNMGGMNILISPNAFGNSKMLYPQCPLHFKIVNPPSLSEFLFKLLFLLTIFGQANKQLNFVNVMVRVIYHKSSSAFFGKTKRQNKGNHTMSKTMWRRSKLSKYLDKC